MYKFLLGLLLASSVVYGATEWGNLDVLGYLKAGNIQVEDNTISSQDTNGDINLEPNGTGKTVSTKTIKAGELNIGGTNDASSLFDIVSTSKGARPFPSMTAAQRDAISSPATGLIIFNTDTNQLNQYDGTQWGAVAGGGGSGGAKNYISETNSKFESGVGDWATFDDGASSDYDNGTGGTSTNLTLSVTTTSGEVLENTQSASLAKAAFDARYEGVSVSTETIDPQDYGNMLTGTININTDVSNYAAGDLKLFAYDVTNSQILLIQCTFDEDCEIPVSDGRQKLGFQVHLDGTSGSETTQVRLSLMVNSTNASAWEVFFDSVTLGPQGFYPAPAALERNVDTAFINSSGTIITQTSDIISSVTKTGTGAYDVNLTGLNVAPSVQLKMSAAGTGWSAILSANPTSSVIKVETKNGSNTPADAGFHILVTKQGDDYVKGNLYSNTEALFKTTKARVSRNTTQSIPSGNIVTIQFGTPSSNDYNNFNAFNTSNYKFTAPVKGTVDFKATCDVGANATGVRTFYVVKNGSNNIGLDYENTPSGSQVSQLNGAGSLELNAGETLEFAIFQNSGVDLNIGNSGSAFCHASFTFEPDLTTYGVYPENKVYEANISSLTTVSSNDTWTDITGSSITLPKGKYDLNYIIAVSMSGTEGDGRYSNVGVFDSNNNLVGAITLNHMESNRGKTHTATLFGKVFSEETTLKLRARKTGGTDAFFAGDSYTSGFTDPDVSSIFQAIRR